MQIPTQSGDTMKALVAVKRVVDYNVKVRAKADGSDVDLNNVKMSLSPFCEIAVGTSRSRVEVLTWIF